MTGNEAEQILDWMTGCFSKRLEPNERHVWLATFAEMDASQAMATAIMFGKSGERFPTVPEFRRSIYGYQKPVAVDESWRDQPPEPRFPIPEWVHVFWWSRYIKEEKRDFPQFENPVDAISDQEYLQYRMAWKEAGSPSMHSVGELLKSMVQKGIE